MAAKEICRRRLSGKRCLNDEAGSIDSKGAHTNYHRQVVRLCLTTTQPSTPCRILSKGLNISPTSDHQIFICGFRKIEIQGPRFMRLHPITRLRTRMTLPENLTEAAYLLLFSSRASATCSVPNGPLRCGLAAGNAWHTPRRDRGTAQRHSWL
jgi:hypothetical protein